MATLIKTVNVEYIYKCDGHPLFFPVGIVISRNRDDFHMSGLFLRSLVITPIRIYDLNMCTSPAY